MAQESCNLDKDEAEILKPSSPSPPPPPPTPPSSAPPSLFLKPSQDFQAQRLEISETPAADVVAAVSCTLKSDEEPQQPIQFSNRCSSCRKKVGLTGFRCRCGDLFCPRHRYSDTHDCSFDYKAAAREEISKANPVIRARRTL